MATDSRNINSDTRQQAVKTIARHIEDSIELEKKLGDRRLINHYNERPIVEFIRYWRKTTSSTYVTTLYLLIKLLYLTNVIGQFFLLSSFLAPRYRLWGAEILIDLANGREWYESGHFPRVTMCDFDVRVLGNLHRYTIQCVLMINMFNEKIYLFLWWWFLFVAIADALNFVYWLLVCLCYRQRREFIQRYLRAAELLKLQSEIIDSFQTPQTVENGIVKKFISTFLRLDGIFILRMISLHAGDLITTEIITTLWQNYYNRYIAIPYAVDQPPGPGSIIKAPTNKPFYGHGQKPVAPPYSPLLLHPRSPAADDVNGHQGDPHLEARGGHHPDDVGFVESYQRTDPNQ